MQISFIIPSRNNYRFLKWSYDSIRKNQGNHDVQICVADDASTDGTWEWCQETMQQDKHFQAIRNDGPERQGLVILNDRLVNEVAKHDLCMIYHADMYLCPGALDAIEKHMYAMQDSTSRLDHQPLPKTIVSLTRIEPPLHPPGPEKILFDAGIEPEEFNESEVLNLVERQQKTIGSHITTEGIFAPWAFWKSDFQEIGGHDKLFAPQSKEDSDIFNRFQLNGVRFTQTWEGFVYHMTSRGSRFNPAAGGAPGKDSPEWLHTTTVNMRNFIRKWGTAVKHDQYMKPIIPPKYNIGIRLENGNLNLLEALEPWCDRIYTEESFEVIGRSWDYVEMEGGKTLYDMSKRVHDLTGNDKYDYDDIVIEANGKTFIQSDFNIIQQLPEIIADSGTIGEFELGNLKISIFNIESYEMNLIKCNK
jgi:glycosyltransferase involved in cell wall biosynthesis